MGTNIMGEVKASPKFIIKDLTAKNVWQIVRIIRKLGITNFRDVVSKETLHKAFMESPTMMADDGSIVPLPRDRWTEAQIDAETEMILAQEDLLWALLGILIDNIGNCEAEINELLAEGIDVPLLQIYAMDANDYLELIHAYISREAFKDFFMQAWRLFQGTSASKKDSGTVIRTLMR